MRTPHTADVHPGMNGYGRPATLPCIDATPPGFTPAADRRSPLRDDTHRRALERRTPPVAQEPWGE